MAYNTMMWSKKASKVGNQLPDAISVFKSSLTYVLQLLKSVGKLNSLSKMIENMNMFTYVVFSQPPKLSSLFNYIQN